MMIILRYVNKQGHILRHFLEIVYVGDTTSLSLKLGMEELLVKHDLSLINIRVQI